MFGIAFCLIWFAFLAYHQTVKDSGLKWHQVRGVTKWLVLGPGETPKCRACEVALPDPILRTEIGYGAFLCEDCEEEVFPEAGLLLPEWFTKPLPPEVPEVTKQPEPTLSFLDQRDLDAQKFGPAPKRDESGHLLCVKIVDAASVETAPCIWCEKPVSPFGMPDLCDVCIVNGRREVSCTD